MRLERLQISVVLAVAVFAWWFVLLLQGTSLDANHLKPFGTVVGILAGVGFLFEYVLWRQRWLHPWFVKRPDLRGTWRVELESDWIDPETQERVPTIFGYMGVVQSFSKIRMHLMTKESESHLVAESIVPSTYTTGYQIVAVYMNKPEMHLRGNRSEMHFGSFVLRSHGAAHRPDTLVGEYWTDRKTRGQMTLSARIPEVLTNFKEAEKAFG